VATFYAARSEIITPLPWPTFALPFSPASVSRSYLVKAAKRGASQNRTKWETNMTLTLTRLIAASLITLPGVAMAADYMAADANQDGMLSYEEVQAILPEVTTDTFMAVDADGDGLINADELAMAQTEGLMPEADS
jgi:hypothetical protein